MYRGWSHDLKLGHMAKFSIQGYSQLRSFFSDSVLSFFISSHKSRTVLYPTARSTMASTRAVPHLMTLADLSPGQINRLLAHSLAIKKQTMPRLGPYIPRQSQTAKAPRLPKQTLSNKTIALLFSKRSTRTRLAAETGSVLLGGQALFLGRDDIQLGVNESPRDTARVIGGMCQGIFARVGEHEEIEVSRLPQIYFYPRKKILNSAFFRN